MNLYFIAQNNLISIVDADGRLPSDPWFESRPKPSPPPRKPKPPCPCTNFESQWPRQEQKSWGGPSVSLPAGRNHVLGDFPHLQ